MSTSIHRTISLFAAAGLMLSLGCQSDTKAAAAPETPPAVAKAPEAKPTPPAVPAELPQTSIYQLESQWTTQTNDRVDLDSFQGKPVVVAMFFGSCRTACPTIIGDMKRIEAAASQAARDQVKFVLITFDPKVDTPQALTELGDKFQLDPKRWTFLHGEPGDIREVAAVLGVQYREVSDGQFTHTNLITLLDAQGLITSKIEGLKQPVEPLVQTLNKLAGES